MTNKKRKTRNLGFGFLVDAPFVLPLRSNLDPIKGTDREVYKFDGENDYVDCGDNSLSNWSIVLNLKKNITDNMMLLGDGTNAYVWLRDTNIQVFDGTTTVTSTIATTNNIDYNIIVTYDGTNVKSYLNGVLQDTDLATLNAINFKLLGTRRFTSYFNGNIYNYKLFNKALNQTEIDSLVADITSEVTGLELYYNLTSASYGLNNIEDLSGNGNHGTSYGKGEFSRTTTATQTDHNRSINEVPIDIPRFQGARYVGDGVYSEYDESGNRISSDILKGILIEEESTNLFLNSTAPVTQSITVLDATVYTLSVIGTGSITLSGGGSGTATEGNDVTFTTTSTSITCTVTGDLDHAQVEKKSFATSPIYTGGTSVTRTIDIAKQDISDIITQGQGALYCEFNGLGIEDGYFPRILTLYKDADNFVCIALRHTTNLIRGYIRSGGVDNFINSDTDFFVPNTKYKILLSYENDNVRLYINGSLINTDTIVTIPTGLTTLYIGDTPQFSTYQANGTLKDAKYYSNPMSSDAEGIRLTKL